MENQNVQNNHEQRVSKKKLNLNNLELLLSAVNKKQYPETFVPEFAFAGRSNVGKSSLINKLLNRKSFARISSVPGKTATINFYEIDKQLLFVDLPGYGYAKRSKEEIKRWGNMIEEYFFTRKQLACVIQLVDSRHAPSKDDIIMTNFVRNTEIPLIVVATKIDKLKKSEIEKNISIIKTDLNLSDQDIFIPFSALTGAGRDEIWNSITAYLED